MAMSVILWSVVVFTQRSIPRSGVTPLAGKLITDIDIIDTEPQMVLRHRSIDIPPASRLH
jgi:hypothetical protein